MTDQRHNQLNARRSADPPQHLGSQGLGDCPTSSLGRTNQSFDQGNYQQQPWPKRQGYLSTNQQEHQQQNPRLQPLSFTCFRSEPGSSWKTAESTSDMNEFNGVKAPLVASHIDCSSPNTSTNFPQQQQQQQQQQHNFMEPINNVCLEGILQSTDGQHGSHDSIELINFDEDLLFPISAPNSPTFEVSSSDSHQFELNLQAIFNSTPDQISEGTPMHPDVPIWNPRNPKPQNSIKTKASVPEVSATYDVRYTLVEAGQNHNLSRPTIQVPGVVVQPTSTMWYAFPRKTGEGLRTQLVVIMLHPGTKLSDYVLDVVSDLSATPRTRAAPAVLVQGEEEQQTSTTDEAVLQRFTFTQKEHILSGSGSSSTYDSDATENSEQMINARAAGLPFAGVTDIIQRGCAALIQLIASTKPGKTSGNKFFFVLRPIAGRSESRMHPIVTDSFTKYSKIRDPYSRSEKKQPTSTGKQPRFNRFRSQNDQHLSRISEIKSWFNSASFPEGKPPFLHNWQDIHNKNDLSLLKKRKASDGAIDASRSPANQAPERQPVEFGISMPSSKRQRTSTSGPDYTDYATRFQPSSSTGATGATSTSRSPEYQADQDDLGSLSSLELNSPSPYDGSFELPLSSQRRQSKISNKSSPDQNIKHSKGLVTPNYNDNRTMHGWEDRPVSPTKHTSTVTRHWQQERSFRRELSVSLAYPDASTHHSTSSGSLHNILMGAFRALVAQLMRTPGFVTDDLAMWDTIQAILGACLQQRHYLDHPNQMRGLAQKLKFSFQSTQELMDACDKFLEALKSLLESENDTTDLCTAARKYVYKNLRQ